MADDFSPENELEKLLVAGYSDPAAQPAYCRALLEGSVVIMVANRPGEGAPTGPADLRIRVIQIKGVTHLPVFTSVKRVEAYGLREGHCLEIKTRALLDAVPDTPVIVNLGSAYSMGFNRAQVAALLKGTPFGSNDPDPQRVPAGGLEIEPLGDPPFTLLGRMVQLFRARGTVRAAYVVSMRNPAQNEKAHPLVGIEAGDDWDALAREVLGIIGTHGRKGEIVNVCRLDGRPLSAQLRRQGVAFFHRR